MGIPPRAGPVDDERVSFNRRWRFLGGDTHFDRHCQFRVGQVSIAGGDSWVGIPYKGRYGEGYTVEFQSQVAILGWGYSS